MTRPPTRPPDAPARAPAGEVRLCKRGHRKEYSPVQGCFVCTICKRRRALAHTLVQRKARLKARRRRIAGRRRVPRTDRIWAAGHFEGEGTFSIVRNGEHSQSKPVTSLCSTDRSMVMFFHDRWPGALTEYTPKSGRAKRQLTWRLFNQERIEGFILDIRPFLQSERMRTKAALLLEDVRARAELRRDAEAEKGKAERHARMRVLNRRGVERRE